MLYALVEGERTSATPQTAATCPHCTSPVIPKCGAIVTWHWAHRVDATCDHWSEPETEWHRGWKLLVPREQTEVTRGPHRADILIGNLTVELQHSSLAVEEIEEREQFYGSTLQWVFDARDAYEKERLFLRRNRDSKHDEHFRWGEFRTFGWNHPRKSLSACKRPVWLDLGDDLMLRLKRLYIEWPPHGGWGLLVTKRSFVARILGITDPAPSLPPEA